MSERADTLVGLMASELRDGDVVATGVASPLAILAIAVARATHAPRLRYLACVGSLDPALETLHRTPEDLRYLDGRTAEVTIPDLFDHARRGRVDAVFFGAAQVDGRGDTNMTAIGTLDRPRLKLPGLAGAATLRRWVKRPVLVIPRHGPRALVPAVDVASTSDPDRATRLLTDLGVFVVGGGRARLLARHPWAELDEIRARTGFVFDAPAPAITPPPSEAALAAIRRIDADGLRHALVG